MNSVLYFDLFNYPLQAEEIWRTTGVKSTLAEVQEQLKDMVVQGLLDERDGFYKPRNRTDQIARRLAGNQLAAERMHEAKVAARRIAGFPFVEAVMISGSMSKNYMDPGSDIDFFIVTRPGRLWIARTLLILYKKTFLLNSHRNFCVNYFVDTEHLAIEDRNIFTATEVVFLLPMVNPDYYRKFRQANRWADDLFPNFGDRESADCIAPRNTGLRRIGEWLFRSRLGNAFDTWCMRRTFGRWRRKFSGFQAERFEVALRTRKYVSKHHPSDFQGKVLTRLAENARNFERAHGVTLVANHAPISIPQP